MGECTRTSCDTNGTIAHPPKKPTQPGAPPTSSHFRQQSQHNKRKAEEEELWKEEKKWQWDDRSQGKWADSQWRGHPQPESQISSGQAAWQKYNEEQWNAARQWQEGEAQFSRAQSSTWVPTPPTPVRATTSSRPIPTPPAAIPRPPKPEKQSRYKETEVYQKWHRENKYN